MSHIAFIRFIRLLNILPWTYPDCSLNTYLKISSQRSSRKTKVNVKYVKLYSKGQGLYSLKFYPVSGSKEHGTRLSSPCQSSERVCCTQSINLLHPPPAAAYLCTLPPSTQPHFLSREKIEASFLISYMQII